RISTTQPVNMKPHPRAPTDERAAMFSHKFGLLPASTRGGKNPQKNNPNSGGVMSYNRQFTGSPINNRRLDYSRSEVDLNEASLNECLGIGSDPSLGPISIPGSNPPAFYFALPDQIAFGPGAQSVVTPWPLLAVTNKPCTAPGPAPINWNRQTSQGNVFQTATVGDINGDGFLATLLGSNDWANVLYRFSAAIDFAGGRSQTPLTPRTTSP